MPEDSEPAVQPFRVCETHIHQCVSQVARRQGCSRWVGCRGDL